MDESLRSAERMARRVPEDDGAQERALAERRRSGADSVWLPSTIGTEPAYVTGRWLRAPLGRFWAVGEALSRGGVVWLRRSAGLGDDALVSRPATAEDWARLARHGYRSTS